MYTCMYMQDVHLERMYVHKGCMVVVYYACEILVRVHIQVPVPVAQRFDRVVLSSLQLFHHFIND